MTQSEPSTVDVEATVKALLDAAQLKVSEDEFNQFVKTYAQMRAGADAMFLPEARYEEPALIYDTEWSD